MVLFNVLPCLRQASSNSHLSLSSCFLSVSAFFLLLLSFSMLASSEDIAWVKRVRASVVGGMFTETFKSVSSSSSLSCLLA